MWYNASKKNNEDSVTELKLRGLKNQKEEPSTTSEEQLDCCRTKKEPVKTTEDQLSPLREDDKNDKVMEKKLTDLNSKGKDVSSTTEKQLSGGRTEAPGQTTEKQLASTPLRYNASKKKVNPDLPIDKKLSDLKAPRKSPTSIGEDQLEDYRADIPTAITEKQLDKPRESAAEASILVEGLLNESKSKIVKHRNEDASKGNLNKLEEQRIAGDKAPVQEEEKSELASETEKDQQFKTKKGDDGLRLAQSVLPEIQDFQMENDGVFESETASSTLPEFSMIDGASDEEDLDIDYHLIEEKQPSVIDQGGTKIQTGVITFITTEFTDANGHLDRELLEREVKGYLGSQYSFTNPKIGETRVFSNKSVGQIGYLAPLV